jgi:F0F1-type ATP synthase assembly protein I
VDFRFKYRRHRAEPHELANKERIARDRLTRMRGLAIGMSIPLTLVAGPLVGWLAGSWLDRLLGTSYWLIALIVVGTVAGFVAMIEALVVLGREQ